jgi:hypothetical protein
MSRRKTRRRRGFRLSEKLLAVLLFSKARSLPSHLPASFKSHKRRLSVDSTLCTLFLVFPTTRMFRSDCCTCLSASSLSTLRNRGRAYFGWTRKAHTKSSHLAALSLCLDQAACVRTCATALDLGCEGVRLTRGQLVAVCHLSCSMRVAIG